MKLLIPLDYLNQACGVTENFDERLYKIHLKEAQIELKDVLGAEFYEEIYGQYDENPANSTFTTANATLYEDYIKDYLAWYTYFDSYGFINSQSTPTGDREFQDDNSTLISDLKQESKEKRILDKANKYKYRLINFLKIEQAKVSTAYPLYAQGCKEEFSFAISSVTRDVNRDNIITITKATRANE